MVRLRIMLTWLLPTLCVAAAGQCVLEPLNSYPAGRFRTSLSAAGRGERSRLPDARSFERSARVLNRRIGTHTGPGGLPGPLPCPELRLPALGRIYLCACSSDESLGLAQGWQFRWRTALEPRAPSSVS